METVQPIRDLDALAEMKAILRRKSYRDYIMFLLGCNTALRVGDLLRFTVGDVRDTDGAIREHIGVMQEKTDNSVRFKLPDSVRKELAAYVEGMDDDDPLFPSRKGGKPITPGQAWRIIHGAALEAGLKEIGTHSMRKSLGYHVYKKTKDMALVQKLLGQKSIVSTAHYVGITDEEVERAMEGFEL